MGVNRAARAGRLRSRGPPPCRVAGCSCEPRPGGESDWNLSSRLLAPAEGLHTQVLVTVDYPLPTTSLFQIPIRDSRVLSLFWWPTEEPSELRRAQSELRPREALF